MRHGRVRLWPSAFVLLAITALPVSPAYAQGGTTSTLSGVVVDSGGGVVPGADVTARHVATNTTQSQVSNAEGAFSFPGLNVGVYTVTVTLSGFKTVVINNVVLTSAAPAAVRAVLEVGGLEEQVVVTSTSEIVQTQSPTVSTTLNTTQITKLPLTSRSAMDFVTFLPGVSTPAGNRQSTINGLPRGTINITLDGVNIQDNTLRSTDGFFAIVSPRLDAIEEVSVSTAAQGAEGAGQGAVQVKFVTRSGSNRFAGSGYHYFRSDKFNANTWFNNRDNVAKTPLKQNQTGFRTGGPIVIPGLFDGHNKAFFFVNYEEFRQPGATTRNRVILNAAAQSGVYSYSTASGIVQVNLLQLARDNDQTATFDPTIARILADIRSAVSGGSLSDTDPNLQRFRFNVPTSTVNRFPTFRIDYNVTDKHRFNTATNYQQFNSFPDTLNNHDYSFPGFPAQAGQSSERLGFSNAMRSTLTSNLVNEARVGYSGAPVIFFKEYNVGLFQGTTVADQAGYRLTFPAVQSTLTSPSPAPAPQSRNATSLLIEDTMNWLKGAHSLTMGGSWTQYSLWQKNSNLVPRITFGVGNTDPALAMFTTTNFPDASSDNLAAARNLYALLTGRVTGITGDARLDENTGQYTFMGTGTQRARMRELGFFVQDGWRVRSNFTINAGVRYELQLPFYPLNNSYSSASIADVCGVSGTNGESACNLFQAGNQPGKKPEFVNFAKGAKAYNVDYDNIGPSVGAVWTPSVPSGVLGGLMGREGDFVLRAGYTKAYSRAGLADFTGVYNNNPGVVIQNPARSESLGNLGTLPLLFRDTARLGPAPFPETPQYPLTDVVTEDARAFNPNIQVPSADTWTAGVQRSLGRNMAIEVRYVGTRGKDQWENLDYNEINILDNGFLNEFRQAQANLAANIAAQRGATFAYTGAPGTAPLPTFLGFFNGKDKSQAGDTTLYQGTNWTSATFLAFLAARNPNPFGMVYNTVSTSGTGLLNNATLRRNAANAGIPANFFVANPDLLGGAIIRDNVGTTRYNSLQLELRRRYAQGLQFQTSYVFGKGYGSQFETFRRPQLKLRDAGTTGDLTHAFKANIVYDLPFGQGRRFGGGANAVLERLIGGWQVGLTGRVQSGTLVDFGNVRLVGMTARDVQNMFKLRFDDQGKKVWMLPQDVIDNTIRAFNVSATTPTGYSGNNAPIGRYFAPANGPDCIEPDPGNNTTASGDSGVCGVTSLVVTGPMFQQFDLRISKQTRLVGRTNIEFSAEMLNVFNHANFVPVSGFVNAQNNRANGNNIANYEVTGLTGTNTSRLIQLVTRINW